MNYDELLEIIGIDSAEEFQYFEDLALVMEYSEKIEFDDLFKLFLNVELSNFKELVGEYFKEISTGFDEKYQHVILFLENKCTEIVEMINNAEQKEIDLDNREYYDFVELFSDFRNWYATEKSVSFINENESCMITFCEAVFYARENKITSNEYQFDFMNI